jgi:hypothetical protein
MEDKTFRRVSGVTPPILDLDWIEDPVARREFEEMEELLRDMERLNREGEAELREAGLL